MKKNKNLIYTLVLVVTLLAGVSFAYSLGLRDKNVINTDRNSNEEVNSLSPSITPTLNVSGDEGKSTVYPQGFFGKVYIVTTGCGTVSKDHQCIAKEEKTIANPDTKVNVYIPDVVDKWGNVNKKHLEKTVLTKKDGSYEVFLESGSYVLCVQSDCGDQPVVLEKNKLTKMDLAQKFLRP